MIKLTYMQAEMFDESMRQMLSNERHDTFLTPYLNYMQPFFDVIFYKPFWNVIGFILQCLFGMALAGHLLSPLENSSDKNKSELKAEIIKSVKSEINNQTKTKIIPDRIMLRKFKKKKK